MASFIRDEAGVTAVEYGLITVAVVLLSLAMIEAAGQSLATMVDDVRAHLAGSSPS